MPIEGTVFHVEPMVYPIPLRFLEFQRSEDGLGSVTFEALASARPERWHELLAEAQAVWDWVRTHAPGPQGPLDDGGTWDGELAVTEEPDGWHSLALTLCGDAGFAAWFDQAFGAASGGDGAVAASRALR
jgi:hypothetical protein